MSEPTKSYAIGVDIGQKIDHSAWILIEIMESCVIVRGMDKYPLGTSYRKVVEEISQLATHISKIGELTSFVVDATGIGAAPAAMFEETIPWMRVDHFIFSNKSKRELMGKVKTMHAFGRLKFANKHPGTDASEQQILQYNRYTQTLRELITEMKQLQAKVLRSDRTEDPEVEIFKTGAHDDLFTALALAIKDVDIEFSEAGGLAFVKDDSWVRNILTEEPQLLFSSDV